MWHLPPQDCHNICRYLGITHKDNRFCIVMTRYPRSLADLMHSQPGGWL